MIETEWCSTTLKARTSSPSYIGGKLDDVLRTMSRRESEEWMEAGRFVEEMRRTNGQDYCQFGSYLDWGRCGVGIYERGIPYFILDCGRGDEKKKSRRAKN